MLSHSEEVSDKVFEEKYLLDLTTDSKYFESVNCILEEYPYQFLNKLFLIRYRMVINEWLEQENDYIYQSIVQYNERVNNKIIKLII